MCALEVNESITESYDEIIVFLYIFVLVIILLKSFGEYYITLLLAYLENKLNVFGRCIHSHIQKDTGKSDHLVYTFMVFSSAEMPSV